MMNPISRTPEGYRAQASACERLARDALSPDTRDLMLYLAGRWQALADEAELNQAKQSTRNRIRRLFPGNRGNPMKTATELRAEAMHLRALARALTDSVAKAVLLELAEELERLARRADNGEAQ
jgi:hypothetical protein